MTIRTIEDLTLNLSDHHKRYIELNPTMERENTEGDLRFTVLALNGEIGELLEQALKLGATGGMMANSTKKVWRGDKARQDIIYDLSEEAVDCIFYSIIILVILGVDPQIAMNSKMAVIKERLRDLEQRRKAEANQGDVPNKD